VEDDIAPLLAPRENDLHLIWTMVSSIQAKGATMKSNGQEREFDAAQESSIKSAILSCLNCMGGTLGFVMIAAGPWMLLAWYL
jgi:hypothetical protein